MTNPKSITSNQTIISGALVGAILLTGGAGLLHVPIFAMLGILLVPLGAGIIFANTLAMRDPQAVGGDMRGVILILVGVIVLTLACVRAVVINMVIRGRDPGFHPDATLVILWFIAPTLLLLGVTERSGKSVAVLTLLFFYWLAFVPLSVMAFSFLELLGFPMST